MFMKPICRYCGESMFDVKIFDGIVSTLMFTCHCDGYVEAEIEEAFEEAQICPTVVPSLRMA